MPSTVAPSRLRPVLLAVLVALGVVGLAALRPARAHAAQNQVSIMQDDDHLIYGSNATRNATLKSMQALGVDYVRVTVLWSVVADHATSTKARRRRFKPDNPATYPKENWDRYDELDKSATQLGMHVYFDVTGPGPSQYMGRTKDKSIAAAYKPNAKQFYKFVKAVGKRYSGTYRDENYDKSILPAVRFWSIWNEPNQGGWLTPQYVHGKPYSPRMYRELYLRAHQALTETGHGNDVILAGETAPLGSNGRGARSPMRPAKFIRELFCVQSNGHPYTGSAAKSRGCGLFAKFASQGGWKMTGWAHHPYTKNVGPTVRDKNSDSITFANINDLPTLLDSIANTTHDFTVGTPIFLTEFGFETNPPDKFSGIPQAQQAAWINQGDEIAYRNPRVFSNAQFLLYDQKPVKHVKKNTKKYWFTYQSGLRTASGQDKPAYTAYALPFDVSGVPPGGNVAGTVLPSGGYDVWGQLRFRPNCFPPACTPTDSVLIQFRPQGSPNWTDVTTVPVTNPYGFFEVPANPLGPGSWRAAYVNGFSVASREVLVSY